MMLNNYFRKLFLKIFFHINPGDISIKHHWVESPVKLHSFKHKGYWWHGKRREKETILSFLEIIPKGGGVMEIGGHIGYFTLIYSYLVGETGRIWVFEPGKNNLPYIRKNIAQLRNITLIEKAVSDSEGVVNFYTENLTGQNNSILPDYSVFDKNLQNSGVAEIKRQIEVVESTTIDAFWLKEACPKIHFIKIDVEGAELNVLRGGSKLLSELKPVLMVEVTRQKEAVFKLMQDAGYIMCYPDGQMIEKAW